MWRQPALLLLYLVVIVVLTWIVEFGFWWDTGYTSFQVVNPLRNLSVSQIRMLLEVRGIQYTAVLEKSEIISLLQQSGSVQYGELYAKELNPEEGSPLEISRKEDFYELVYDEEETVWVVEVVPGEGQYAGHRLLDDRAWRFLTPKLQALHVGTAVLSCQHDRRFCARQGWSHPQLLLILPPPHQTDKLSIGLTQRRFSGREHVFLSSTTHLTATVVLAWLSEQILSRIPAVQDLKNLEETWLNVTHVSQKKIPNMVYISELMTPPLLLATLGLRLSTRIKLAVVTVKKDEKEQISRILKKSGLSGIPSTAVVTSEGITTYGGKKGETHTHPALHFYICSLQPHMNDAFLVSLMVANLLAVADFFYFLDLRIRAWKHIVTTFTRIIVYNVTVFLLWLAVIALLKFPIANSILQSGSWLISSLNSSWLLSQVRYHWLIIESNTVIFWVSAMIFCVVILAWRYLCRRGNQDIEDMDVSWWSVFPMDSYLVNVLFRPMSSLSRPRPSQDLDLEESMERLIQRLATPDLWLHPVIPTDYMKDLPMWRYDGWGNEDDLKSESETDVDSVSENENDNLLDSHVCCQDYNCRLCELWTTVKEIYVCHRCAILKRKLERQYMRYREIDLISHQNATYEKLLKVCENCCKTRKQQNTDSTVKQVNKSRGPSWLLSPQRLTELKWTAPTYAIESRICAICLGRYRWSAVLCGLPCGHNYHHACITEWLLKDNHHCPTCRWPSYKTKATNFSFHRHEE